MERQRQDFEDRQSRGLALGLGGFSIALGIAELAAPRSVARLIGVQPSDATDSVLRTLGAREIASGVAILAEPDRAKWLWSRVGGDVVDLSLLCTAARDEDTSRGRAAAAIAAVVGVTALDVVSARQLQRRDEASGRRTHQRVRVHQAITINAPIEEVYRFWRNFENLPRFMRHLESVQQAGDRRSRWRAKGPAGTSFEWEAELTEDTEHERIAWQTLEGSEVQHSGSVRFQRAPAERGTEIHVHLEYTPPAGLLGRHLARLFGEEPEQQLRDDLRRFKQLIEAGEIPISEGPGLWRAAQPPADPEQLRTLAGEQP